MTEYVAGHVQEGLAHAGETDVHVRVESGRLLLTGTVATDVRRDAAAAIATRLAEGLEVRNEISIVRQGEPGDQEHVA